MRPGLTRTNFVRANGRECLATDGKYIYIASEDAIEFTRESAY